MVHRTKLRLMSDQLMVQWTLLHNNVWQSARRCSFTCLITIISLTFMTNQALITEALDFVREVVCLNVFMPSVISIQIGWIYSLTEGVRFILSFYRNCFKFYGKKCIVPDQIRHSILWRLIRICTFAYALLWNARHTGKRYSNQSIHCA